MLHIKNGRVIDPASRTDAALDVLLDGDRITQVGPAAEVARSLAARPAGSLEFIDATGLIVAPGFIDLHCHLREPGDESSETRAILERAQAAGSVRVWPIGAASAGSKGEALAEIAAMREAGIVAVSDDGRPIATARLLRHVMDYCRSLDLTVIDHCEDASLVAGAVMREGHQSVRLGLHSMPAAAESIAVARDIQVAELTGCRLHVAHLSTRASLELVRAARRRGLPVTCEVTPHHFTLTDEDVGYDTRFKMNPPLGSREDREALLAGLADGTVDAIATDHAPHEPALKDV